MVSIIVPAYNAAAFIGETIESVLGQSYSDWELTVIDDGSTDQTAAIVAAVKDKRVRVVRQANSGVARARNNGLLAAQGEYLVFLDADDLMTPGFLELRVRALDEHPAAGFAGGLVETFPVAGKVRRAVARDPENEILFFNPDCVTVPSNYMFRKSILLQHKIFFNTTLSSTADRFFILELSKVTTGIVVEQEEGKLLYRYTSDSMSNRLSPSLIIDNEKFYYELKKKSLFPARKQLFKSLYFLSLSKGFALVGYRWRALGYLLRSFLNHPAYFAGQVGGWVTGRKRLQTQK
jgi:glycosyltransferase involved in cell wall biosynthesis